MRPPTLFKTDGLLAVSEDQEDSFPVDLNRRFQALVNQNKWRSALLHVEPMNWRGEGEVGVTGWSQEDRGKDALCVYQHTWLHNIVSQKGLKHPAN